MPLPEGDNTSSPPNSDYFPSRPNAAVLASKSGSELPLENYKSAPNRHRSKVFASRGKTLLLAPAPRNPRPGTQPRRGAPPPGAAPDRPAPPRRESSARNSAMGALINSVASKIRGPPRPHRSRFAAHRFPPTPPGLRLFSAHNAGLWPPGVPRPAPPAQAAGGTHTSSPRLGRANLARTSCSG